MAARRPGRPMDAAVGAALREALLEGFRARFRASRGRFEPRRGAAPAETGAAAPSGGEWRAIVREIKVLHEGYTVGGREFAQAENPIHALQAGYQFYFLPRNLYRVSHVLEQLPWAERAAGGGREGAGWPFPPGETRAAVLDLGCGTGAFSLAVLARLAAGGLPAWRGRQPTLRLVLVDQGRDLLALAQANLRAFARRALPGLRLEMETHADGAERYLAAPGGEGGFALAGGAMMVNELNLLQSRRGRDRAVRLVTPLLRRVADGGVMLLVEPGTRKGYMHLMAVRDVLAGQPILYPCPHANPCPMWDAKVRRWCHATAALPAGFFFDEALRGQGGLGLAMRELNLAALAVQVTGSGRPLAPFGPRPGARVVSGAMPPRETGGPVGPKKPEKTEKTEKRGEKGRKTKEDAPKRGEMPPGTPGKVVLTCNPGGDLREIAAAGLGGQPRGAWVAPEPPGGPAKTGGRRWKNRP